MCCLLATRPQSDDTAACRSALQRSSSDCRLIRLLALLLTLCLAQGYNRVAVNAALNTGQSLLEIAGSWVVLAAMPAAPQGRLAALGAVSVACASLTAIIGVPGSRLLGLSTVPALAHDEYTAHACLQCNINSTKACLGQPKAAECFHHK